MKVFPFPLAEKQGPSVDPWYPMAVGNAKKAYLELLEKGIIDKDGNRIRTDTPPDMEEDSGCDFGG
ncbi:MAG: hypothetical protein HY820_03820 [Acidobacteria bacterium]|nr:hypothetical protein [Acidobacteriota bacterium]